MKKGDPLPAVSYTVPGETFDKAIEKRPMKCCEKFEFSAEALAPLQQQAAG